MLEALCFKCGETFVPADEQDLIHQWSEEQHGICGGQGTITREYIPRSKP